MVKKIGIIGDSIAHGYYDESGLGWFARLGQMILEKHPGEYVFNNMSQAGNNVADAYSRAVFEVGSREFDLILVNIGINDLRRRQNSDLQLDLSEGVRIMYWNLLLDVLKKTGAKIVVMDLIPVIEKRYIKEATHIRCNTDVIRYNEVIKRICDERNILLFERFADWVRRDLNMLYKDATHPNAEGHQLIAEEIFNYLEKNKIF